MGISKGERGGGGGGKDVSIRGRRDTGVGGGGDWDGLSGEGSLGYFGLGGEGAGIKESKGGGMIHVGDDLLTVLWG